MGGRPDCLAKLRSHCAGRAYYCPWGAARWAYRDGCFGPARRGTTDRSIARIAGPAPSHRTDRMRLPGGCGNVAGTYCLYARPLLAGLFVRVRLMLQILALIRSWGPTCLLKTLSHTTGEGGLRSGWYRGTLRRLLLPCLLGGLSLLLASGAYASADRHGSVGVPGRLTTSGTELVDIGAGTRSSSMTRAGNSSVRTTFHVTTASPVGGSLWSVSGSDRPVTVGAAIVGPGGVTIGYHVVGGGSGTTVSSHAWGGGKTLSGQPLFTAALYASDSNAQPRSGTPVESSPGYVDDLGKFGLGQGPGWVAVDPTTGNYLLLSAKSVLVGSYQCGPRGQYCSGTATTSLGEVDVNWFGVRLNVSIAGGDVLASAIPNNRPFTGTGCYGNWNYYPDPAGTCTGGNLNVTISPVGVLRGRDAGERLLSESGGRTEEGGWSPGGEYVLYLTGVTVFS